MNDNKFDHIGLADTRSNYTYLPEEDRIPQRFLGHFMSQKLDSMTVLNCHDYLPFPY